MEKSLLETIRKVHLGLKLSNREQAQVICSCSQLLCTAVWIIVAASLFITSGNSLTFASQAGATLHSSLLISAVALSLATKLLLVVAIVYHYTPYSYGIAFTVASLHDGALQLIDIVAAAELFSSSDFPNIQIARFTAGFTLTLGFLCRFLNQLIHSSYRLTNSVPNKRLPHYWNIVITQLLLIAVIFSFTFSSSFNSKACLFLSCLMLVGWNGYYVNDLPYIRPTTARLKLLSWAASFSILVCLALQELSILQGNLHILYVLILTFVAVFGSNYYFSMRHVHYRSIQELLFKRIDGIESWMEAAARLHHMAESLLYEQTSNECFNSVLRDHRNVCVEVACMCRETSWREKSIKTESQAIDSQINRTNYYKRFLLSQSLLCLYTFPQEISVRIAYLSALGLLSLYPRLLSECRQLDTCVNQELSLLDKVELEILRYECIEEVRKGPASLKCLNVQLCREYESDILELESLRDRIVENKCKLWNLLRSKSLRYSQVQGVLEVDVELAVEIESLYEAMFRKGMESESMWNIMLVYSKFIAEDHDLLTRIRQRCKLDTLQNRQPSLTSEGLRNYLDGNKCATLLISSRRETFGRIEWHSNKLNCLYGADSTWKAQGHNVNILLPEQFGESHEHVMLNWYATPTNQILEQPNNFMMETLNGRVKDVRLYIRIVPLQDQIQMYVLLELTNESDEYILLNEKLRVINRPKCLYEFMKATKLEYNELDFGLLSSDFLDIDWKDSALVCKPRQFQFELRYSDEYNAVRRQYLSAVDELRGDYGNSSQEVLLSLQRYFLTQLERTTSRPNCLQLTGKLRMVKWPAGKRFIAIKIQQSSRKVVNQLIPNEIYLSGSVMQSGEENFEVKQGQRLVDTTITQSILPESERVTLRHHTTQTSHILLRKLSMYLVGLIVVFCLMFIIRSFLTMQIIQAYQFNMQSDSSVSDVMQLTELTYDYTLLLRENVLAGGVNQPQKLTSLNNYIIDFCLKHMASDENGAAPTMLMASAFQLIDYLQVRVDSVPAADTGQIKNAVFLRMFFEESMKVMQSITESIAERSNKLSERAEHAFSVLVNNFPTVAYLNQHFLDIFKEAGVGILQKLYELCHVVLTINFLCSLAVVWLIARYQYKTVVYTKQLLELFTSIEPRQIVAYEEYYLKLNKGDEMYETQPLTNSELIKKCSFEEQPTRGYRWYHLPLLLLLVACEVVCCSQTYLLMPQLLDQLDDMNLLLQAQNYQIEAQIEQNELVAGIDKVGSKRFRSATNKIDTPDIAFVRYSSKLLRSRLPENIHAFEQILVGNICEQARDVLLADQYQFCLEEPKVTIDGILATMSYSQRMLQQSKVSITNQDSQFQLGLLDPLYFFQFRIYQLLQNQILNQLLQLANEQMTLLIYAYSINIVCMAVAVCYFAHYSKQQRKSNYKRYCYLLSIPKMELKKNKYISKYVSQINQQTLFG